MVYLARSAEISAGQRSNPIRDAPRHPRSLAVFFCRPIFLPCIVPGARFGLSMQFGKKMKGQKNKKQNDGERGQGVLVERKRVRISMFWLSCGQRRATLPETRSTP
jgi:hypothetical protein